MLDLLIRILYGNVNDNYLKKNTSNAKMKQTTVMKNDIKELTEEEQILNNPILMKMLRESEDAERKGIKPWKIRY